MVTTLDRLAASASAMAGTLYVLAALFLWGLIVYRRRDKNGVIYDRAVAWSALAVLFSAIAAGLLDWVEWDDMSLLFALTTAAVAFAGLFSVRAITRDRFGYTLLASFVVACAAAGIATWVWG